MAINVSQSFKRTSANPIDETLTLTKAQMLAVNDNLMPNKYLTVCQDDGAIYLYDKSATPSVETGKFTKFEGGGGQGGGGITIDATLTAANWNSGTKQQTVTFTGYQSSMGGVIGVPASATSTQKTAYTTAKVNVVSVSGTSFTFECEEIPSINLPVTLYAGGSSGGGGADLPSGGTTGQALVKHSDADQDVEWADVSGVPSGGSANQVLTKNSATSGDVKWASVEKIQYESSIPAASSQVEGKIIQYTGTSSTFKNGLFYKCIKDGSTYKWVELCVQEHPDVDLTNVFASGMPSASIQGTFNYSTEEQVVGKWIDGKPLYQKTITGVVSSGISGISIGTTIDKAIYSFGMLCMDNWYQPFNTVNDSFQYYIKIFVHDNNADSSHKNKFFLVTNTTNWNNANFAITIQYTKTTD